MKKCLLTLLFLSPLLAMAQQPDQRGSIWYFGDLAGLTFGSAPQPLTDSRMGASSGGVGTICDEAGQLVFYSDGKTVWNRYHRIVPGAGSLVFIGKRQGGSTQNGILLPHPTKPDWYYVFSIEQPYLDDRYTVYYSLLDSKANGGEGGFVSKLTLLARNVASSVAVVRHCNNRDFWLILHDAIGTNTFRTYLLDEAGVSTTPLLNNVGSPINDNGPDRAYLKASPDGKRLAMGFYGTERTGNFAEVFGFDNKTGQVGQRLTTLDWPDRFSLGVPSPLEGAASPGDIAFSSDNQYLYVTRSYGSYLSFLVQSDVYQFDLKTKAYTQLATKLYNWQDYATNTYNFQGLENGPDGRLYVSHLRKPSLSVITNPNAAGTACNFQEDVIGLAGRTAGFYLPFRYPPRLPDPVVTIGLLPNPSQCNDVLTPTISGFDPGQSLRYQWYRDGKPIDNANGPAFTVLASGSYTLLVEEANGCRQKLSPPLPVTVKDPLLPPVFGPLARVCVGSPVPLLRATGQQVRWYVNRTLTQPPAGSGPVYAPPLTTITPGRYTYYATQTDAKGCTSPADSISVQVLALPQLTVAARLVEVCPENSGVSAILQASAGSDVQFGWSLRKELVGNQAAYTATVAGRYIVTAIDANQCVSRDSVDVVTSCYRLYIPTAFSPNDDQTNDALVAYGSGISRYRLVIYNRWGDVIFASQEEPFTNGITLWDGRYQGSYAQPGMYTYQLQAVRQESGDRVTTVGSFLLLR